MLGLGVAAAVTVVLAVSVAALPADPQAWVQAGTLVAAAGLTGLLARRFGEPPAPRGPVFITLDSCWLIPAAVLLPLPMAAPVGLLVAAVATQAQRRTGLDRRTLFSCGVEALSVTAAAAVGQRVLPPSGGGLALLGGLVLVLVAYTTVNYLIVVARWLSVPELPWRQSLADPVLEAMECALLCLGALLAVLLSADLALVALAVPIVLVLHRLTWVRLLRERAERDAKTGLLNATA